MQEGVRPDHLLPQLLWSPVLDVVSPLGAKWPPGHLLCPVLGCPAIAGTLKEPYRAEPDCGVLAESGGPSHNCPSCTQSSLMDLG